MSTKTRKTSTGSASPVRKNSLTNSKSSTVATASKGRRVTVTGNAPTLAQLRAADRDDGPAINCLRIPEENGVIEEKPGKARSRRVTVTGQAPNPADLRKNSISDTPRGGARQDVVGNFLKEKGIDKHLLHQKGIFRQQYLQTIDKELERDRKVSQREVYEEKRQREKLAKELEEKAKVRETASLTMYANLSPEARRAAISEEEDELYAKLKSRFPKTKDLLRTPATLDRPNPDLDDLTIRVVKARDVINRMLDSGDIDDHDLDIAVEAYNAIQDF